MECQQASGFNKICLSHFKVDDAHSRCYGYRENKRCPKVPSPVVPLGLTFIIAANKRLAFECQNLSLHRFLFPQALVLIVIWRFKRGHALALQMPPVFSCLVKN